MPVLPIPQEDLIDTPLEQEQWVIWRAREAKDAAFRHDTETFVDSTYPWMWQCRPILADWMFEVCEEIYYPRSTCYQAISLMDRAFLHPPKTPPPFPIGTHNYQCVGLAAIFVTSSAIQRPLRVNQLPYFTDYTYTEGQIQDFGWWLLEQTNWNITAPTSQEALEWLLLFYIHHPTSPPSAIARLTSTATRTQLTYLLDVCQHHPELLHFSQYAIALACLGIWSRKWTWCGEVPLPSPPVTVPDDILYLIEDLLTLVMLDDMKTSTSLENTDHHVATMGLVRKWIAMPSPTKKANVSTGSSFDQQPTPSPPKSKCTSPRKRKPVSPRKTKERQSSKKLKVDTVH